MMNEHRDVSFQGLCDGTQVAEGPAKIRVAFVDRIQKPTSVTATPATVVTLDHVEKPGHVNQPWTCRADETVPMVPREPVCRPPGAAEGSAHPEEEREREQTYPQGDQGEVDQLDHAHVASGSGQRRGRRGICQVRLGTVLVVVPAVV